MKWEKHLLSPVSTSSFVQVLGPTEEEKIQPSQVHGNRNITVVIHALTKQVEQVAAELATEGLTSKRLAHLS